MPDDKLESDILLDASELRHLTVCSRASVLGALGWAEDDIRHKPLIGIVNSCTDLNPGHMHLDKLAAMVREGILQAGGVPFEFNTPAPCDAFSCGLEPMKYVLPQRDLIADSIEMKVRCNSLDGLVFLSSCDKIVPGQLMAAARLNMPAIFVTGGPMLPRLFFEPSKQPKRNIVHDYMTSPQPKLLTAMFRYEGPGAGACTGFGTANTMQCLTEVLGLALSGCGTIHAVDADKLRIARASGRRIVAMVQEGLTAGNILTKAAFHNAICAHTAMGGSTNGVIHLLAIAHEMGVALSLDDFDTIGREIPCVCGVIPSGPYDLLDLHRAGGIPALLKRIERYLDGAVRTVDGLPMAELLAAAAIHDNGVIRPLESPFYPGGGLAVLRGNLCPGGAVIKQSAVRAEMRTHTGPAKVYNSEVEARESIDKGLVEQGDVIVIRYEGPKGGPGMREMLLITRHLVYSGKADSVALVTDGRFSGFTSGPAVGHICPEAAEGGPIALVQDGDIITINIPKRTLTLHVPDDELTRRKAAWKPLARELDGYLRRYSRDVVSASEGAWLK